MSKRIEPIRRGGLFLLLAQVAAAGLAGDFTGDSEVNLPDFAVLAENWALAGPAILNSAADLNQDEMVDLADLALFADLWLSHLTAAPEAHNVETAGFTDETLAVTLLADDDGRPRPPGKLRYILLSADQGLSLQDPAAGAGLIAPRHLPWTLSSWGKVFWCWSKTSGTYQVQYTAFDGQDYALPAEANVSLSPFPQDCLSFDGRGQVCFDNHPAYNPAAGWAVHLWIRTRTAMGGIVGKRGGDEPGWQIDLIGGKAVARLFGDDGSQTVLIGPEIDDGRWHSISLGVWEDDGALRAGMEHNSGGLYDSYDDSPVLSGSFDNDRPVILGATSRGGFQGEIDKLRFFDAYNPADPFGGFFDLERNGDIEPPLGLFMVSVARFMFSEGDGDTVTDDKGGLAGQLSSLEHVRWRPFNIPFVEVLAW